MTFKPRARPPKRPEKLSETAPSLPRRSSPAASQAPAAAITPTRLAREREAFHVITEAAVSDATLPEIARKILSDLLGVLDFDSATLRLYDPAARMLHLTAFAGRRVRAMMDKFPSQPIDDPHFLGAYVARERQPVFAPAIQEHPIALTHAARIQELGLEGVIAYPIADGFGNLRGVLTLNARDKRQIKPGERTFFEAVVRMLGTIIEHRQAVDALSESEAAYRSLFENAPAALWVEDFSEVKAHLDRLQHKGIDSLEAYFNTHPEAVAECAGKGRILDVNRQTLELFQAPSKEALVAGLARIMTPGACKVLAGELLAIAAGVRRSAAEIENRTLGGEKRQLVMQWFVAPGHESDYGRVILSFLDITETRELEIQLMQAQKMESVGTLAGGIAHDFNNIMQAISGYTQLMLWDRHPDDPDYSHLQAIEKAAERASKLTQQLLTFSRKVPSTLKPVNLNAEIENVRRILERTIPKMIRIECRLASELAMVDADRSQIEQVLMNLGINASSAMPDGGRLVYETRNVELDRAFCLTHLDAREGPHVLIRVSDTGHGMDPATRRRIFDPFFTTRQIGEGFGLGLAIVYGVVKNHNGHIVCHSEPGKGACFNLYLPARVAPPGEKVTQPAPEASQPSGSETILLVDDEPIILDLAETILKRHDYRVMRAASGEQALERLAGTSGPVDLVILDLNMPGMGGHNCLDILQRDYPEVPVLLASGYSAEGSGHEAAAAGAAGFIAKPYQLKELLRVVRDILDARKEA